MFPGLLLIPVLFSAGSLAGTVNNELGYQLFRDFAENKGMFRPGATNIAIYNKQGEFVGTLDKAAMPDFSAVDSEIGVATLINPQYIASVKHNGGYTNVSFGDGENRYNIVDRNNAPSLDFHAPRLDKLVTEVAPTAVTAQGAVAGAYLDKERYPVFYRLGSGTQYIKDSNGQLTQMGGAYSWLTGGTVGSLSSYQNGEMISTSSGLVLITNLMVQCPFMARPVTAVRLYLLLILFRINGCWSVFLLRGMARGAGEITGLLFHWILSGRNLMKTMMPRSRSEHRKVVHWSGALTAVPELVR